MLLFNFILINNKPKFDYLKAYDIYHYLNSLVPYQISGTDTLDDMFKYFYEKQLKSYKVTFIMILICLMLIRTLI
jgi:hypothetical protein